jgi:hypothetical protein
MLCAVTPRDDVLAELTGAGPPPARSVEAPAVDDVTDAPAPPAAVKATMAPTIRVRNPTAGRRRTAGSRDRVDLPT